MIPASVYADAAGYPRKRRDLTGQKFGRLTVVGFSHRGGPRRIPFWRVRCDCGTEKVVAGIAIKSGGTVSCGCYYREHNGSALRTHGLTNTPEFRTWRSMLQRAHTGVADCAQNYLGRGIAVCERWLAFENFLADMGPRPTDTSIDRIDNNRGYEPGNCRWATQLQQQRNRRSNHLVTAFGRTLTLAEWSEEVGLSAPAIAYRLRSGWAPEEALSRRSRQDDRV